jgi:hypothetical protein
MAGLDDLAGFGPAELDASLEPESAAEPDGAAESRGWEELGKRDRAPNCGQSYSIPTRAPGRKRPERKRARRVPRQPF